MSNTKNRADLASATDQALLQRSIPIKFSQEVAEDLLYGFDVDDDSREFLTSLIANNRAPRDEVERLYDLSLMGGVEDWNNLLQCATSLRDHICSHRYGPQLTPYLAVVHLKKHGSWSQLESPRSHTKSQSQQRRTPDVKEVAGPRTAEAPRSLKRQYTSHFFEERTESTKTAHLHKRSSSNTIASPDLNNAQPSQTRSRASEKPDQKRRRASSVVSTSVSEPGLSATKPREPPHENLTAGHFLPPQTANEEAVVGLQQGFNLITEGHFQTESSEASTGDKTPKQKRNRRADRTTTSHFFSAPTNSKATAPSPSPSKRKASRPARGVLSALPIPPLSAPRFGLIQEELADDPFRLLIAVTFLIRTAGRTAIPVFRELISRYPTPEAIAAADPGDIIPMIHHLGLSSNRCTAIQKYARLWLARPPVRDVRYGVKNYPRHGDGKDVKLGEEFGAEDDDVPPDLEGYAFDLGPEPKTKARGFGTSWEIGHLTQGPYAIDSWRIFCRDVLLGRAEDWKGKGRTPDFQPEWMRVLPQDKELRACLRWMWMKEGWSWDPLTGEREVLSERLRRAVDQGRVAYDNQGQLRILDESGEILDEESPGIC